MTFDSKKLDLSIKIKEIWRMSPVGKRRELLPVKYVDDSTLFPKSCNKYIIGLFLINIHRICCFDDKLLGVIRYFFF